MKSEYIKNHYRLIIVICCFLTLFINQGLASTSFSVYQTYIVQLPGVSDAGGSLVVTVRTFVALIAMFLVGIFYRVFNVRIGLFLACLCTALGFFVYGLVGFFEGYSLIILCIGAALCGIGYGLGGIVASTILIGNWFHGHIGSVAGIVGMGSGVAAVVIPVIAADIIAAAGLSVSFFAESGLALLLAITIFLLVRTKPEDVGVKAFEAKGHLIKHQPKQVCLAPNGLSKFDRRAMIIAVFLLGASTVVGMSYFSVLMTSSGVNLIAAAVITSVFGVVLTVAKVVSGETFDIIGTRSGSVIFSLMLIIGLLLCFGIGTQSATDAFFAAVFFGIGSSLSTTGLSVWSVELSTSENRMKFLRALSIAFAFGGFIFNMMPGILVGVFGDYEVSYLILAIFAMISGALVFLVYSRNMKCEPKTAEKK